MIINRDNFTAMTILPFGVQDWVTDRQYRQLHPSARHSGVPIESLPKSDRMNSIAQTMIDIFGLLFSSSEFDVGINCCAIATKKTVNKNSESYDPANTEIIVLDLENPKRATGDAALAGVPEPGTRSSAPASRRRKPVRRSRR